MTHSKLLLVGLCALGVSACAAPMTFQSSMSGAQESPRTSSSGTGTMTAKLYPDTRALNYTVNYTGLSGPATAAHIHGPADTGSNGPVLVPFASPAAPITGTTVLTEAQQDALIAGKTYVNVHTAANPGGEIRGQIARVQ